MVNNKKIKIVNYRFKDYKTKESNEKTIELISKIKMPVEKENLVEIEIVKENEIIKIYGRWKCGFSQPGNYIETFIIEKKIN